MEVGHDKIADFTFDNYAALELKHPQSFFVHKALTSFPNGSSSGLDGVSPHLLKNLTAKLNGQTGLNFLRALTNLVNVILEGKVPFELRRTPLVRN